MRSPLLAEASRQEALAAFGAALDAAADRSAGRAGDRTGSVVVSATIEVDRLDPCACVFASRLAGDHWFCWSEPERGFELAALGEVLEVSGRGPGRFGEISRGCAEALAGAELRGEEGPHWVGGFAFDDRGGRTSQWSSFPPGSMTLPEVSFMRRDERVWMTLNARLGGAAARGSAGDRVDTAAGGGAATGVGAADVRARMAARLGTLREAPLGLLDPHPTERARLVGSHPPERFERSVADALAEMAPAGAGGLRKVVLAREVVVRGPSAHDAGAIFGALREAFPSCFVFCRGTREGAFTGASPELLVRRSGASAATVALAGSTRRSSDPAMDDHLGEQLLRSTKDRREQEIVARRIVKALEPCSVWVEAASEPSLARVANIQHLATPILAQLAEPRSAIELAGLLHPTPAVGGEPWPTAAAVIDRLEGIDRGWYAGPVGWMDATDDGEFCVALRSALLRDRDAHLYAGVGVVPGSVPADELAETELKLAALLPLFDL